MFIKITKNREGKRYVSIVEGYREGGKVKQRTVHSFGQLKKLEAENPNFLEKLKEDLKTGKFTPPQKELQVTFNLEETIHNPLKNYGWLLLKRFLRELDISKLLTQYKNKHKSKIAFYKALELLVSQRILNPTSKLQTVQTQKELFGNFHFKVEEIYRSLDVFSELSEEIQFVMHQSVQKKIGRNAALVFYDVTNYYFETDLDDEETENNGIVEQGFRKRGPSKEKRPNPIIQMGLFMDTNGIPIAYKLFPGNCVDVKTYLPALKQVKKQFGLDRIVVVADKGMNSKRNIAETINNGDGYLFSQKCRGSKGTPKDIQSFVLDHANWETNPSGTFAKKSFIRKRTISGREVVEKVLATWNQKYDFREKIRRKNSVDYAEKLTASEKFRMTMSKGGKRYLNVQSFDTDTGEISELNTHISINREQIEFDEQFDGFNVLITSETEMIDEEILSSYRSLSQIEDCFRTLKTDFEARPIFLSTKAHIEGHFLICFIALTLMRIITYSIDHSMSSNRIQNSLLSAQCKELSKGYWEVFGNEKLQKLNTALGIEWEKSYIPIETLRKYGKSLGSQHLLFEKKQLKNH